MNGPSDEPDKAASLDSLLDRLPPPQMPEGLAARIVRDVTRLPQVAVGEPLPEPVRVQQPVQNRRHRRRHWMVWAGGGTGMALAASLAAALLLPSTTGQGPAPAETRPRSTAPATAEATPQAPAPAVPSPRLAEDSAATTTASTITSSRPDTASPAPQTPPPDEVANASPATTAAPPSTPTDSIEADDEAEMVDSGNSDAPTPLPGAAPAPRGWGYAPGATNAYPRGEAQPSLPDEPIGGGGPHRRGRRF